MSAPVILPDWLARFRRVYAEASRATILVDGDQHAAVRVPGSMQWSRIGERRYAPTTFLLVNKDDLTTAQDLETGRVSKALLARCEEAVRRADAGESLFAITHQEES